MGKKLYSLLNEVRKMTRCVREEVVVEVVSIGLRVSVSVSDLLVRCPGPSCGMTDRFSLSPRYVSYRVLFFDMHASVPASFDPAGLVVCVGACPFPQDVRT